MDTMTLDEIAVAISEATGLMEPSRERLAAGVGIGIIKMLEAAPEGTPVEEIRETVDHAFRALTMIAAEEGAGLPGQSKSSEADPELVAAAKTIMGIE